MMLRVRLFVHMARTRDALRIDAPEGMTVSELPALLRKELPDIRWPEGTLLAVNQEYVPPAQVLRENDEVAVIPPVSGG